MANNKKEQERSEKNVYAEVELAERATAEEFLVVQLEGKGKISN